MSFDLLFSSSYCGEVKKVRWIKSWRRTFPDSAPGTDGVAIFEGRVIGRVRHMTNLPRDPKPWSWSVTDPDLAGRPGWANTSGEMPSRRQAMARLIERWQELGPLALLEEHRQSFAKCLQPLSRLRQVRGVYPGSPGSHRSLSPPFYASFRHG